MQKIKLKGKLVEAIKRSVQRRNRAFKKLTPAEKRVAVARDVLAQIRADKVRAMFGEFVGTTDQYGDVDGINELASGRNGVSGEPVDLSVLAEQAKCHVCGIGALFVSAARIRDNCSISSRYVDREHIHTYLEDLFSNEQLRLIEAYFEEAHVSSEWPEKWYPDYRSPIRQVDSRSTGAAVERLTMIMENIISNRGRFNPHRGKHRVPKETQ